MQNILWKKILGFMVRIFILVFYFSSVITGTYFLLFRNISAIVGTASAVVVSIIVILMLGTIYFILLGKYNKKILGENKSREINSKNKDILCLNLKFKQVYKHYKFRKKKLLAVPWIMIVGTEGSDKHSLIKSMGINEPTTDLLKYNEQRAINWLLSSNSLIVDLAVHCLTKQSSSLLNKNIRDMARKRRGIPVTSLVVCISAGEIINNSREELKAHSEKIQCLLKELAPHLQVTLPIYLIVTDSEEIKGFDEFFNAAFSSAEDNIVGFDFQNGDFTEEAEKSFKNKFNRFITELYDVRLRLTVNTKFKVKEHYRKSFMLPGMMEGIKEKLKFYINCLGAEHRWNVDNRFFVRGVYFTGGEKRERTSEQSIDTAINITSNENRQINIRKDNCLYASRLFNEKIVNEKFLCRLKKRGLFNRLVLPAVYIIVLSVMFGTGIFALIKSQMELKSEIEKEVFVWKIASDNRSWKDNNFAPILITNEKDVENPIYYYNSEQKLGTYNVTQFDKIIYKITRSKLFIPYLFRLPDFFVNLNLQREQNGKYLLRSSLFVPLLNSLIYRTDKKDTINLSVGDYKIIRDLLYITAGALDVTGNKNDKFTLLNSKQSRLGNKDFDFWFKYIFDEQGRAKEPVEYLTARGNRSDKSEILTIMADICTFKNDKRFGESVLSLLNNKNLHYSRLIKSYLCGYPNKFLINSKGFVDAEKSENKFFEMLDRELIKYRHNRREYLKKLSISKAIEINSDWTEFTALFNSICNNPKVRDSLENSAKNLLITTKEGKEIRLDWKHFTLKKDFYIKKLWKSIGLNEDMLLNEKYINGLGGEQYDFYKLLNTNFESQLNRKNSEIVTRLNTFKDVLVADFFLENINTENALLIKNYLQQENVSPEKDYPLHDDFNLMIYFYSLKQGIEHYSKLKKSVADLQECLKYIQNGKNKKITFPDIPLTDIKAQEINSCYLPDNLQELNKKWKAVIQCKNDAEITLAETTEKNLYLKAEALYKTYLDKYYDYWEGIIADIHVNECKWDVCQKNALTHDYWSIKQKLEKFYKLYSSAIKTLSEAYPEDLLPKHLKVEITGIDNFKSDLDNSSLNKKIKQIWLFWRHVFSLTPVNAKNYILKQDISVFISKAFITDREEERSSIFKEYWYEAAVSFLNAANSEYKNYETQKLQETAGKAHFPLAETKGEYNIEDCKKLLDELKNISCESTKYTHNSVGGVSFNSLKTLPEGIRKGILSLVSQKNSILIKWFRNAKSLLKILKTNDFTHSTCLYFDSGSYLDNNVSDIWPALRIVQSGYSKNNAVVIRNTNRVKLGSVSYPGNKTSIELFRGADEVKSDKSSLACTIEGEWSLLRFFLDGPIKPISSQSRFWITWKAAVYNKEKKYWIVKCIVETEKDKNFYFNILIDLPEKFKTLQECCQIQKEIIKKLESK